MEFERVNFLQMEKTDGHLRSDSWLRFLLSQDFSENFLEQGIYWALVEFPFKYAYSMT